MQVSATRYGCVLFLQLFLLFFDFCANIFICISKENSAFLLILFIIQDVCLVLALVILLLSFIGTYIFQAGFIEILFDKFKATIIISFLYLLVTIACHVWWLFLHYEKSDEYNWTSAFIVMYIMQGMLAPIFYHFYRRTALRMSDPRFYEPLDWVSTDCRTCQ